MVVSVNGINLQFFKRIINAMMTRGITKASIVDISSSILLSVSLDNAG